MVQSHQERLVPTWLVCEDLDDDQGLSTEAAFRRSEHLSPWQRSTFWTS